MTTSCIIRAALLLAMPMFLSGCMISGYTYMSAMRPDPVYRNDKIKSVDRAVETPDGELVVLLDGKMAGASKAEPFTVTIPIAGPGSFPESENIVTVPRRAIIEGRHLPPNERGLLPISVVPPVILPAHEDSFNNRDQFPGLQDSERTLYVSWCQKHDINAQLVYVVNNVAPSQTFYCLDEWKRERAHNYTLLLLLPATVVADAATFPFQLFVWALNPEW